VIRQPEWSYLAPIRRLSTLYDDLSFTRRNRLRKVDVELRKDGTMVRNPQRMGPLTMDARRRGLAEVLSIQDEVNQAARLQDRPEISLINEAEHNRILELIAANTWPDKWDGTEAAGDALVDKINRDGTVQPLLLQALEESR
jgi:DNA sulfur modification protein DndC